MTLLHRTVIEQPKLRKEGRRIYLGDEFIYEIPIPNPKAIVRDNTDHLALAQKLLEEWNSNKEIRLDYEKFRFYFLCYLDKNTYVREVISY